jgi:hypothetical protein
VTDFARHNEEVRRVWGSFNALDRMLIWRLAALLVTILLPVVPVSSTNATPGLKESEQYLEMASPEYRMVVEKPTGILRKIESLQPAAIDLIDGESEGLVIYVTDKDKDITWKAGLANGSIKSEHGIDNRGNLVRVSLPLGFGDDRVDNVFDAVSTYTLYDGQVNLKVRFTYKKTDPGSWEIGIKQQCKLSDWQYQIYTGYYENRYAIADSKICGGILQYGDCADDADKRDFRYWAMPRGIVEGNDRWWLWGFLDLGGHYCTTPNREAGWLPWVSMTPKVLKGKSYTFDIFYKVLPKPENDYTDVVRWYARNVCSSDPFTKGIVTLTPEREAPRTLFRGRNADVRFVSEKIPDETIRRMAELQLKNQWYGCGARHWDDTMEPAGTWTNFWDPGIQSNPEMVKAETDRLKSFGLHPFMYIRQFGNTKAIVRGKPIDNSWFIRMKDGHLAVFDTTRGPGGIPGVYARYDFCNDEMREWFVEEIKHAVDFYQPDGICWDMGWGDAIRPYSTAGPYSGNHHGVLRAIHDIYVWSKAKYPEKKIWINSLVFPDLLWVDGMLVEGGQHSDLLYMGVRAYNIPIMTIDYEWFYKKNGEETVTYRTMRGLALGSAFSQGQGSGHPLSDDLGDIAEFMADTACTPPLFDHRALRIERDDSQVFGSVWASSGRLMAAIFNDGDSPAKLEVRLDRRILARNGYSGSPLPKCRVINSYAKSAGEKDFKCSSDGGTFIEAAGTIGPKELLLLE